MIISFKENPLTVYSAQSYIFREGEGDTDLQRAAAAVSTAGDEAGTVPQPSPPGASVVWCWGLLLTKPVAISGLANMPSGWPV